MKVEYHRRGGVAGIRDRLIIDDDDEVHVERDGERVASRDLSDREKSRLAELLESVAGNAEGREEIVRGQAPPTGVTDTYEIEASAEVDGESIQLQLETVTVPPRSGHAKADALLSWLDSFLESEIDRVDDSPFETLSAEDLVNDA